MSTYNGRKSGPWFSRLRLSQNQTGLPGYQSHHIRTGVGRRCIEDMFVGLRHHIRYLRHGGFVRLARWCRFGQQFPANIAGLVERGAPAAARRGESRQQRFYFAPNARKIIRQAIQVLIESKPRSNPLLSHFFFTKPVSTFVRNALERFRF